MANTSPLLQRGLPGAFPASNFKISAALSTPPTLDAASLSILPPYAYKVITGPQVSQTGNVYARVIGDAANASVYITPGEGL